MTLDEFSGRLSYVKIGGAAKAQSRELLNR
jgi:hypothetical protein